MITTLVNDFVATGAATSNVPPQAQIDTNFGASVVASTFQLHFLLLHLLLPHVALYSLPAYIAVLALARRSSSQLPRSSMHPLPPLASM